MSSRQRNPSCVGLFVLSLAFTVLGIGVTYEPTARSLLLQPETGRAS